METTNQLKGELFVKDKHPGHQNGLANYRKNSMGDSVTEKIMLQYFNEACK